MPQTILRLPAVKVRTGLSRSAIYLLVSQGTFPCQIKLGARSVGWLEEEIERWVLDRVQQNRNEKHENGTSRSPQTKTPRGNQGQ